MPRDFWLLVFSWISFPQPPKYTIRAVSNFFENLQRYSPAQGAPPVSLTPVANWRIFNQKFFNYFVWTPLGSRVNIYINFCLQVHLKVSAVWYCFHYLPPVSLLPGGKFATGINNTSKTGGKICRCRWHRWQIGYRCRWYRWCTLTCEYLREFSKTNLNGPNGLP